MPDARAGKQDIVSQDGLYVGTYALFCRVRPCDFGLRRPCFFDGVSRDASRDRRRASWIARICSALASSTVDRPPRVLLDANVQLAAKSRLKQQPSIGQKETLAFSLPPTTGYKLKKTRR